MDETVAPLAIMVIICWQYSPEQKNFLQYNNVTKKKSDTIHWHRFHRSFHLIF